MGEGISWKGVFVVWTAVCEEQVSSTIVKERGEDGGEIHEKSVTRMIDERSSPLLSFFAIVKNSVTWVLLIAFYGPKWCNYRALAVRNNRRIVLHNRWNRIVVARSWDELICSNYYAFFFPTEKLEILYDDRFKFLSLRELIVRKI